MIVKNKLISADQAITSGFDGINQNPEDKKSNIEQYLNQEYIKGKVPDLSHESQINQPPAK